MLILRDKTAVVTGSASGVGRALCEMFLEEGMKVVLGDINPEALDATVKDFKEAGYSELVGIVVDVTSPESMLNFANEAFKVFHAVHVLCNNAGVGLGEARRKIWDLPPKDWDWGFAVNTMGTVNGIRAFVPRMLAGGDWGHVINTSSGNGGLTSLATTPIYAASKAAVTSLTEVLHYQLLKEGAKIKASVLFPGPHLVNTGILNSSTSRPDRFATDSLSKPAAYLSMKDLADSSGVQFKLTEPEEVAAYTLKGIREGKFWILPASEKQDSKIKARTASILNRENPIYPE